MMVALLIKDSIGSAMTSNDTQLHTVYFSGRALRTLPTPATDTVNLPYQGRLAFENLIKRRTD